MPARRPVAGRAGKIAAQAWRGAAVGCCHGKLGRSLLRLRKRSGFLEIFSGLMLHPGAARSHPEARVRRNDDAVRRQPDHSSGKACDQPHLGAGAGVGRYCSFKNHAVVILSGAKNLSLVAFHSNRREILRSAQNDKSFFLWTLGPSGLGIYLYSGSCRSLLNPGKLKHAPRAGCRFR